MGDIASINGQDAPSGGGISANSMPGAGVNGTVVVGGATMPSNPAVTLDFNIGPIVGQTFTKIVVRWDRDDAMIAIKADGTLWYNMAAGTSYGSWGTLDGTWRQHGEATDWTDISAAQQHFTAVKGGDLMFTGYGGYRTRGDGSTSSESSWVVVNSALTWSKTSTGYYHHIACTTAGHVYYCGYNWNYQTGQGTTSGTTTTLTRDQFNLTGVTEVSAGTYQSTKLIASGDVYSSGMNNSNFSGPLITSTSAIDGPLQSTNVGDIILISRPTYWAVFAINSSGELLFAGNGSYRNRPDNSTSHQQGSSCFDAIDGGATGWTYYGMAQNASTSTWPGVGIKSGQMVMGGGTYSHVVKEVLGSAAGTTAWINVGSTGITACAAGQKIIVASW